MELIHSKLLTFMAIVRLISTMLLANPIINMEILGRKEVKTVSKWDSMVRGRMLCVGENIQKRRVDEKEFSTRSSVNQNHWKLVWNVLLALSHQQTKITKSYQQQKSGNFSSTVRFTRPAICSGHSFSNCSWPFSVSIKLEKHVKRKVVNGILSFSNLTKNWNMLKNSSIVFRKLFGLDTEKIMVSPSISSIR